MISRVAESCFWLARYTERIENMARLVKVNRVSTVDTAAPDRELWEPLIIVAGELERFTKLFSAERSHDGDAVQEYLTWDERNPVSIVNSMRWARENARTIRDTISAEMWETINGFWLWLRSGAGRRLFGRDRDAFYAHVRDWPHMFYGITHTTMLHGDAFLFMGLGMHLERAGQTARIIDIKHHALGPTGERDTPLEDAEWLALLHSCSASDQFLKRHPDTFSGAAVAAFLLLSEEFPRSVLHSVDRAGRCLERIRSSQSPEIGEKAGRALNRVRRRLEQMNEERLMEVGHHAECTRLINDVAEICNLIHSDYFNPSVGVMRQSQTQS